MTSVRSQKLLDWKTKVKARQEMFLNKHFTLTRPFLRALLELWLLGTIPSWIPLLDELIHTQWVRQHCVPEEGEHFEMPFVELTSFHPPLSAMLSSFGLEGEFLQKLTGM